MATKDNPYEGEQVIEYGTEDKRNKETGEVENLPYVITETTLSFDPNNKPRNKYWGADIPGVFIHQVEELETAKRELTEFEEWKNNRFRGYEEIDVTPENEKSKDFETLGL